MLKRRYHITLGARTTAGGVVTTATSACTIDGVDMAVEGDLVSCPVCQSDGKIVCDGPRLQEEWNGRQAALSDDLCACKCSPPPRLVAIQTYRSQDFGVADDDTPGNSLVPTNATTEDEAPIRLLDRANRQPYRNQPYRLEFPDKVIEGVTDEDGLTRPLSRADRSALLAWHVTDNGSTD